MTELLVAVVLGMLLTLGSRRAARGLMLAGVAAAWFFVFVVAAFVYDPLHKPVAMAVTLLQA
jgi:hypothetical protein